MARRALALLSEAGWVLENDVLRKKGTGEPFAFEMLVNSRQQERLALNFSQSLSRIGIQARVRLVDDVQYWRRLARFDFDMVQWLWPGTPSPGNEQRNRWGSAAAQRSGSLNHAGVASPADRPPHRRPAGSREAGRISSRPFAPSIARCCQASMSFRCFI